MSDQYGRTWTDDDFKKSARCNEILFVTEFGGITRVNDYCRPCKRTYEESYRLEHLEARRRQNREAAARRYIRNRLFLDAYCEGRCCTDCGETDPIVFDFDHVRGTKLHQIGDMLGQHAWETIEAELLKCDIRCANCHRRKTAIQCGWRSKGGGAK